MFTQDLFWGNMPYQNKINVVQCFRLFQRGCGKSTILKNDFSKFPITPKLLKNLKNLTYTCGPLSLYQGMEHNRDSLMI